MNLDSETASVEVIFGSVARRAIDARSDRDYLIIDDNYKLLRNREQYLTNKGWSVASYSKRKFEKMIFAKQLFIQHLKLESCVIVDMNQYFWNHMENFSPKTDYTEILDESKDLLRIIQSTPRTYVGLLWSMDVCYVAVRNYMIAYLANEGIYKFAFYDMLFEMFKLAKINLLQMYYLSKLRLYKNLYRTRINRNVLTELFYEWDLVIKAVQQALSIDADIHTQCAGAALECRKELVKLPYGKVRTIEKKLICLQAIRDYENEFNKNEFSKIWMWVTNPRQYMWYVAASSDIGENLL